MSAIIQPVLRPGWPAPNLPAGGSRTTTFDDVLASLQGLPGGGLNIAHEAVGRHLGTPIESKVALRFLPKKGDALELTYAELAAGTNRFVQALRSLGVGKGDRVFTLLGRVPELYLAVLGTLKNGSVLSPLFSAFGPEPVQSRLSIGDAKVVVTTPKLYKKKVKPIRDRVPSLEHVLLVGDDIIEGDGVVDLKKLLANVSDESIVPDTKAEDMALLHFTSGTTGKPKGAVHVQQAVAWHHATARWALDLHEGDVFWCTADPGWVTGTSYGIIGPLTVGVTSIIDEREYDAERWLRTLEDHKVSVWYTAPTAVRMLMKAGDDLPKKFDLSALRFIASVGEPLNPEAVKWGLEILGLPIHDNWWQSETGGIMIANVASRPIKPGSMGRPLPGIDAVVVERLDDGGVRVIEQPDTEGELALKTGWPSMFRGYLHEQARYDKCFRDGWYLTGDLVKRDADGDFWFVGRADDVIKTAGHLIGPFEVESALIEHEAVAEAAIIGVPDEVAGHILKAFVTLHTGHTADEALITSLMAHARKRLGPAVAPRIIDVVDDLPRTRSGKIMRRLLKARELGLEEGDTSTLERREDNGE